MKLSSKTILLISPERWDHIFVSKHHYAIHLAARGNRVFFLNPPSAKNEVVESGYENLKIINYKGFITGMRFFPVFFRKLITLWKWRKLELQCEATFDVIWSFDNSVFYDFDALPQQVLKISHIVDLNQDFQFENAAKTADMCIGVSKLIHEKLEMVNPKSIYISHGYSERPKGSTHKPALPGNNPKKALYIGNLAMPFLDWETLYQTILQFSKVDFVFVGPGKENLDPVHNVTHAFKAKISENNNCFFLDRISAEDIPDYLLSADILLICYQENHHRDQSNPHKMMEYLASGRPIVSTFTADYERISDLLFMSRSNAEFTLKFSEALAQEKDGKLRRKRKAYALDNTYSIQITRIDQKLNELVL